MKKGQVKIDEFAFVLLAGLLLIVIMMVAFSALPQELPPMVTPPSISLSVAKGSSDSFIFTVNGTSTKITLDPYGEIKDWLNFDKNFFPLSNSTDVKVTVVVPTTAAEGVHTGYITVSSSGGNRTLYVNINVLKFSITDIPHPFYFNDMTVSYSLGSEIIASKEDVEVVRGTFANSPLTLVNDPLTNEKLSTVTSGFVSFVVDDTNRGGDLIIELNGRELFRRTVGPGEINLALDASQINNTNTLTVRTESPGWKFWTNSFYRMKSVKLGINYLGISSQEKTFSLDATEVNNFEYARVNFRVKNYLTPQQELVIKINGQVVYTNFPTLNIFREDFRDDVFGNPLSLNVGSNTISFSLEKEGMYELGDVNLIVVRHS